MRFTIARLILAAIVAVILAGCDTRNQPTPTARDHALIICPDKFNCLDMPKPTPGELEFTK